MESPGKKIASEIKNIALQKLKEKFTKFVFLKLALAPVGIKAKIVLKIIDIVFKRLIFPFLEDLKSEGFLIIRRQELKKKLERYINANTNEEFDDTFDDLITGSSFK